MLQCRTVLSIFAPWSLLLLVWVLFTEKCANKICIRWILCFAGYYVPLLGQPVTWIGRCHGMLVMAWKHGMLYAWDNIGDLRAMFPLCQQSDGLFEHYTGFHNMLDELTALRTPTSCRHKQIREPPVYKWLASCPMPGGWPVKQTCYWTCCGQKGAGKKNKTNRKLATSCPRHVFLDWNLMTLKGTYRLLCVSAAYLASTLHPH